MKLNQKVIVENLIRYLQVPMALASGDVKILRRAQLLNFILIFIIGVFLFASVINFLITEFYLVAVVEAILALLCMGTFYWFRTRQSLTIAAWIASLVTGLLLLLLIVYAKGGLDTYALVLIFPLVAYPLLGMKQGSYAYIVFGTIVIMTTVYGTQYWAFTFPAATIFNVSVTLILGGGIIYYFEYTKEEALDKVHRISMTDPLTGIWNRKMFNEIFDREISNSKRYNLPLSLVMSDLDHFKKINDTFGHQVGDAVLTEYAKIVIKSIRSSDHFSRWGGEEFALILPNTSISDAESVAKSLIEVVCQHQFEEVGKVTVSIGVGELNTESDRDEYFQQVDEALYSAKQNGRNQYVLAELGKSSRSAKLGCA